MSIDSEFDWGRLGDINEGRKNLGDQMPVAVYRLMQYTIMDELVDSLGSEGAEWLMRRAGFRAGHALATNLLNLSADLSEFVSQLQRTLKDLKIGIMKMEKMDIDKLHFTLTVDEDLDCSGLPISGDTVCFYDEGFIAGILEAYTKKKFTVREIDCWATGDRTCRFTAAQEG